MNETITTSTQMKQITEAPIDGLGATFTVVVPRYSITALVIPKS
jgi:hypothetical protein